jgi:hypothetical protein
MIAASALIAADEATPQVAAAAVHLALEKSALRQASEVILFLSPEFARHAAPTVTAASRAAGCLQVFGSVAAGVASDEGWVMDRPAAAALVLGRLPAEAAHEDAPRVSLCGKLHLPTEWRTRPPRCGLLYSDSLASTPTPVWQGARLCPAGHGELSLPGCAIDLAVSTGVEVHPERWRVETAAANDMIGVRALGDDSPTGAAASLGRILPAALREQRPLPIHLAGVHVYADRDRPARWVALVSANADGSITLAESLPLGTVFSWALRLPATAEADMRRQLAGLDRASRRRACPPAFGLFLSCIGRGPFFYAGADRDLDALCKSWPGLPFVGAYGSGQVAPDAQGNVLLQNSVVSALVTPES